MSRSPVPFILIKATNILNMKRIRRDPNWKLRSLLSRINILLSRLLPTYLPCKQTFITFSLPIFFTEVKKLEQSKGFDFAIKYVKTSRNAFMRFLSGEALSECPGVKLDSRGIPCWLVPIWDASDKDIDSIRIILTLLTSLRSLQLKAKLDLSTIETPTKADVQSITDKELYRALRFLSPRKGKWSFAPCWTEPHMSTKRGPYGQAILTSMSELTLLPRKLIRDVTLLGGTRLGTFINENLDRLDILKYTSVADLWAKAYPPKGDNFRRLSFFSDKEGKTRVVGILDYWSQTSLLPLHKFLNRILRGIPMDCTFDQSRFISGLSQKVEGHKFHSIDLSAATDRMPISLQRRVISFFAGDTYANTWVDVLTSYAFTNVPMKVTVKYAAGQPMGAYSSWPAMALTHHIIVQIAAQRSNIWNFDQYSLLGDDLVIANDSVAEEYKKLLVVLDMPFSVEKTHTSFDVFEFAKRWYYKGHEVTGFAVGGLLTTYKRYPLLHNFLSTQASHGWKLPIERHPCLIHDIHSSLYGKNLIINKNISMQRMYMLFDALMTAKSSTSLAATLFFERSGWLAVKEVWQQDLDLTLRSFEGILAKAKLLLIEKDLYSFQNDAYKVNSTLNGIVDRTIKEVWGDNPETHSFVKETLSVVLNWNNPIVIRLNSLIDKSTDFMLQTVFNDPSEIVPSFLIENGLQKYFVSHGVFSMRNAFSISLAESAVLKSVFKVLTELTPDDLLPQSQAERNEPVKAMESGFHLIPRLGLRYLTPRLKFMIPFIRRASWRFVKFTSIYSIIWGLLTQIIGVQEVLNCLLAIWTAIQALIGILPVETHSIAFIVVNLLIHSFELLCAGLLIAILANFHVISEITGHYVVELLEGVIDLPEFFMHMSQSVWQTFVNAASGVIPVATDIILKVDSMSVISQITLGALLTWILTKFVKWLLFGEW